MIKRQASVVRQQPRSLVTCRHTPINYNTVVELCVAGGSQHYSIIRKVAGCPFDDLYAWNCFGVHRFDIRSYPRCVLSQFAGGGIDDDVNHPMDASTSWRATELVMVLYLSRDPAIYLVKVCRRRDAFIRYVTEYYSPRCDAHQWRNVMIC